jgi:hypothetical protein
VVHTRSSSRHPPDPLTAGLFPQRSPPRLLTGAACGGLGSPPARRTQRANLHHWHSTVRAGDLLHRLTPLSGHTAERRILLTQDRALLRRLGDKHRPLGRSLSGRSAHSVPAVMMHKSAICRLTALLVVGAGSHADSYR